MILRSAGIVVTPFARIDPRLRKGVYTDVTGARAANRLLARDGWGCLRHKGTEFGFYVRSHWLRMPPAMLARHLWTKFRKK